MKFLECLDGLEKMAVTYKLMSKRSARLFVEDGNEHKSREYQAVKSPKYDEPVSNQKERRSSSSSSTSARRISLDVPAAAALEPSPSHHPTDRGSRQPTLPVDRLMNGAELELRDMAGQEALSFLNRSALQTQGGLPCDESLNFGVVVPGVYRSSYPRSLHYGFIQSLGLKTIVTLVQKDLPDGYQSFINENGIRHIVFNIKGTKKEDIPIKMMKSILRLVLDQQNHPLLVHCNHGRHRTGCVVAVVRKLSGWEISHIIEEYKTYAEPKIRECDIKYITAFELARVSNLFVRESNLQFRVRNFFRVSVFAFFVLVIWVVSGAKMASQKRYKYIKD